MPAEVQARPYVFVSHAQHDKAKLPLLRTLVDRLIAEDIKVWLDKPHELGFSNDEIDRHFLDLRGDRGWESQINEALTGAACILLCVSERFCDRYRLDTFKGGIVRREVTAASLHGNAVACRIDAVPLSEAPDEITPNQIVDVFQYPQLMDALVRDVRNKIEAVLLKRVSSLGRAPARDPFLPFLANRRVQEQKAELHLRDTIAPSVRALIVKAPRNECPDQFIDRLIKHTTSNVLGEGRCSEVEFPRWPLVDHPDEFSAWFERSLLAAFRQPGNDASSALRRPRQAPLMLVSVVDFEEWTKTSIRSVRAWANYWQAFAAEGTSAPLLPVLLVETEEVAPGWKSVPILRNRRGVSTRQVWKDLQKLEKEIRRKNSGVRFGLELLDVLGPLTRGDADNWRRTHVRDTASDLHADLGRTFDEIFSGKARKNGVCMKDWSERLRPTLQTPRT